MSRKLNPQLDQLLRLWGAWRAGESRGLEMLGYPNMSPATRFKEAPGNSSSDRSPNYFTDPDIANVNIKILTLRDKQQIALWCNYVRRQYERDKLKDDERCAIICGVSGRREYIDLLEAALKAAGEAMGMKAYIWSQRREAKKKLDNHTPPALSFL